MLASYNVRYDVPVVPFALDKYRMTGKEAVRKLAFCRAVDQACRPGSHRRFLAYLIGESS
jgi:hypothetical protein